MGWGHWGGGSVEDEEGAEEGERESDSDSDTARSRGRESEKGLVPSPSETG